MPLSEDAFLTEWHRIVAEKDLAATLAPEVTLGAAPCWAKLTGRELVAHLLGLIPDTIEALRYRREWSDGDELALSMRTGSSASIWAPQPTGKLRVDPPSWSRSCSATCRALLFCATW